MTAAPALDLRELLAKRFPDAVPLPARRDGGISTGLAPLDRILPNGGLPRGRPTLWSTPGAGATALLSQACRAVTQAGMRAAWIDTLHQLGPGWCDGPVVFRPRTPLLALRFAEILAASGGFALVVLHGVAADRTTFFRLSRAVHEGGGAFAMVSDAALPAALRLRSRYVLDRFEWARTPFGDPAVVRQAAVAVDATASGWNAHTVLSLPVISHAVRCALPPGLADRRGAD
ncbi:MAG TPA: hypothetical protein VHW65_03825 [Gemmatimonadales bacterium]|nr:hypothetical protein [Gemmatimonadales bacterium]